jgi:hypothetical protein
MRCTAPRIIRIDEAISTIQEINEVGISIRLIAVTSSAKLVLIERTTRSGGTQIRL